MCLASRTATLEPLGYSDQAWAPPRHPDHGLNESMPTNGQARYGGDSRCLLSARPEAGGLRADGLKTLNLHLLVHYNLLVVVDSANLFSIYGSCEAYYAQSMQGWRTSRFRPTRSRLFCGHARA